MKKYDRLNVFDELKQQVKEYCKDKIETGNLGDMTEYVDISHDICRMIDQVEEQSKANDFIMDRFTRSR